MKPDTRAGIADFVAQAKIRQELQNQYVRDTTGMPLKQIPTYEEWLRTRQLKMAGGGSAEDNLKRFLKDSKVKDRLYHGTGNLEGLTSFDPKTTGKGTDQLGSGFYFTTHPDEASGYAGNYHPSSGKENKSPGVIAAHLAIRKPIKIGPKGSSLNDARINLTHDQIKQIMEHAPDIMHPENSPLGNHVDVSRGVTPKIINDIAKLYMGNTLHAMENDLFPDNPTAYRKALNAVLGYDGVIKDFGDGRKHYVAWFPEQIKSAIGNRGTYDPSSPDITKASGGNVTSLDTMKYALAMRNGMYSPLEKAAINVPRTKGTPAEFMAEASKQPGYRAEEVKDRAISLPQQKMSKGEFLEHLGKHPVPEVKDVMLGDVENPTKFHEYQLPGGKNYRELLLTLPISKLIEFDPSKVRIQRNRTSLTQGTAQIYYDGKKLGREYGDDGSVSTNYQKTDEFWMDVAKRLFERGEQLPDGRRLSESRTGGFHSSHYDQPNIIAHVRFNDRTNHEGKPITFLEEVQSDWGQAGDSKRRNEIKRLMQEHRIDKQEAQKIVPSDFGFNRKKDNYVTFYRSSDGTKVNVGYGNTESESKKSAIDSGWGSMPVKLETENHPEDVITGVPSSPFVTNTESWSGLALRKMLKHAVDSGHHGLGWTTGQHQADRYDLSKQVNKVVWHPETGTLAAQRTEGGDTIKHQGVTKDKLADYIGKDAAERLIQANPMSGWHSISGDDLKVGGEGMKSFYDKIIPAYLNKFGKKYKSKVGRTRVETNPGQYEEVHHFPITDEMRQDISKNGVPMYREGGSMVKRLAQGGPVTLAQMKMALARKGNPIEMQSIGINEAPDLSPKVYMPPDGNKSAFPAPGGVATPSGMAIGGIDMSRMMPGQQLLPQPQMPQQPAGAPQATPQQPGMQPGAQPQGGQSNILQMTPQGQAMNAMTPQKMARGGQPEKKENPLVVLHNTNANKLAMADKLGGFAVPSLAIVNPEHGFHNFGDISFVGHPKMAEPSKNNPVFASDVYSPRFPSLNDEGTKIYKGFTNAGKRRYVPLTLENAIKEMKGNIRGGENWNYGAGSVRSGVTPKFKNINQIKNSRTKIIPKEKFEPIKKVTQDKLLELAQQFHPYSRYSGNSFQHADDFSSMLQEAGTRGIFHLKPHYEESLPPELLNEAKEYLSYLRDMPSEYFEAKPQRGVGIHEFSGAIVPYDKLEELLPIFQKHGISRVETYGGKSEDEIKQNRIKALSKFSDHFFCYGGKVKNQPVQNKANDGKVAIHKNMDTIRHEMIMTKKGK